MRTDVPHARALMRPRTLIHLYRARLRAHLASELIAGAGVAVAVALVFATLVANGSIAASAGRAVRTVAAGANLQLRARGEQGFPLALLGRVEHVPGVKQAAPLLETPASIATAGGRQVALDLVGTDVSLAVLDGLIHRLPLSALMPGGIGLSRTSAQALGLSLEDPTHPTPATEATVTVMVRGSSHPLHVSSVLGREQFGALSEAFVAVMPLERMQALTGLRGRISRILIRTAPGRTAQVRSRLTALTGGRIAVTGPDQDIALLDQALRPSNQASDLFAAIGALLGFLFAFCAFLLTVPERRETIADMRTDGARRSAIVQMVLSQALALGLAACLIGLAAGYVLSVEVFQSTPGYLDQAFVLGDATVIGAFPVLAALATGLLAIGLASAVPLLDLRRSRALDAVYAEQGVAGHALHPRAQRQLADASLALLIAASLLFAFASSAAILACLLIALASVLCVPLALHGVLRLAGAAAERYRALSSLPVAVSALRSTTLRSLALAATGSVALFGSVALGGARSDLMRGIARYTSHYVDAAAIWALPPQDNQATDSFPAARRAAAIARIPGVRAVDSFQGSFLDVAGQRRIWVIGWPASVSPSLLDGQMIQGGQSIAAARIRGGGWAAVSAQLAAEDHLRIGGTLRLATPSGPLALRIAATTTNFGWSPGALVMSAADYARAWGSSAPSALGIQLAAGAQAARVRRQIAAALGPASGLEVLSAAARARRIDASAGEGLSRLQEISTLLIATAILAMLAALIAGLWQRRASLADLRIEGARPARLRRILALEAAMLLLSGALVGALAGIYGQAVIDSYLRQVTGFPVAGFAAGLRPLAILAAVLAIVAAAATLPAWLASRVPATLAFDD